MFELSSYQTFFGVVITLAIVCLFAGKENGSSFISQIVNVIGDDLLENINRKSQSIKEEVSKKRAEIYSKYNLSDKVGNKPPMIYLYETCGENTEIKKELADTDIEVETINREILAYVDTADDFGQNGREHIKTFSSKRFEPQFMAFFVLLVSIVVLLLTVLPISFKFVIPFVLFFTFYQLVFSFVVWLNYFKHKPHQDNYYKGRKIGLHLLSGLIVLILPSFVFVLFMFLPFEGLSIISSVISFLLIVLLASLFMFNRRWHKHIHSRTIILTHIFYFGVASVFGYFVLMYFIRFQNDYFLKHYDLLFQPNIVFGLQSILLVLNLIFVPLYGGYLHMKIDEWRSRRVLRKTIAEKNQRLSVALEKLEDIIVQIIKINKPVTDNTNEAESM